MNNEKEIVISLKTNPDDKNLNSYIEQIHKIKRLGAEEEHTLVKLKEQGDIPATRRLVEGNLWFVVFIARQYAGYKLPMADLIQEGNIGLMKAVKNFESKHSVRVVSYAIHWINHEIKNYIIKNLKIVNVATTKEQRKIFFKINAKRHFANSLTEQAICELSEELNVKKETVREMETRLGGLSMQINPDHNGGSDSNRFRTVTKQLISSTPTPSENLEYYDSKQYSHIMLESSIKTLPTRTQDIIYRRWLDETNTKPTLHELADEYGVSAERIRQIEREGMDKIKAHMTN